MTIDTEPRKNELLPHCSPEFQEQVKREQENKAKDAKKEDARRLRRKAFLEFLKAIAIFFAVVVAASIGLTAYESYESHQPVDHDTPVWMQGNWLVGEYRVCQMRTKMESTGPESLVKLPRLFCAQDGNGFIDFQLETDPARKNAQLSTGDVTANVFDNYFHVLPVRYYGSIQLGTDEDFTYDYDRTDKLIISWRCQRLSESLECKALD